MQVLKDLTNSKKPSALEKYDKAKENNYTNAPKECVYVNTEICL